MRRLRLLLPALLAGACLGPAQAWDLLEGARVHPELAPGVPRASDVVFSVRSVRPDAIDVAKAFGATRVEWVYTTDREFIARARREIGWFGGSQNANTRMPTMDGKARDFDGVPIVHPRMRAWNVQWNTTTHPLTQQTLRNQAADYLAMGADSLQIDDPLLQLYAGQLWGGDFNEATQAGFPAWLRDHADPQAVERAGLKGFSGRYHDLLQTRFAIRDAADYQRRAGSLPTHGLWLAYLQHTVAQHFAGLRQHLRQVRGAPVPLSMNLSILDQPSEANRHFFLTAYADYAMSETLSSDIVDMKMRVATARALGLGLVASPKQPQGVLFNRYTIAAFYALGANPLAPWDVYIGNDDKGQALRYYGRPEDYRDLYAFVRERRDLFDQLETAAVVGIVVPVDRYNAAATMELVSKLDRRRIPFAFVPVGGRQHRMAVDPARLAHFKVLVTPNAESDFAADDWRALRLPRVPWVAPAALRGELLDGLVPFVVVGGAERLQVFPRAAGDGKGPRRLVLHLVDEARATSPPPADCRRRVAIRPVAVGGAPVERVTWQSPGNRPAELPVTQESGQHLVTVPECALWGLLDITLGRDKDAPACPPGASSAAASRSCPAS